MFIVGPPPPQRFPGRLNGAESLAVFRVGVWRRSPEIVGSDRCFQLLTRAVWYGEPEGEVA